MHTLIDRPIDIKTGRRQSDWDIDRDWNVGQDRETRRLTARDKNNMQEGTKQMNVENEVLRGPAHSFGFRFPV